MTMTNAELAAAIEWAWCQLGSADEHSIPAEIRLIFDHLTELLKIQRERAQHAPVADDNDGILAGGKRWWFYREPYGLECEWHDKPLAGASAP